MRSLRGRLTLGITSVLALILAAAGLLVVRDVDRSERQVLDDRLRRTAELSRATALTAVEQELPGVDRRLEAVLRATGSSLRLTVGSRVVLDAGTVVPGGAPIGLHTITVGGRRYRTYVERLQDPSLGGLARLEVTSSLRAVERREGNRRRRIVLIIAAALAAAAAGVWFAADLVLRPLRRLRAGTARIATEEDLDRPVPEEGPTEVRQLAASFNAMLARLGRSAEDRTRALEATRRFAADAGHELRTPLTSVQATLSALARHPDLDPERRTGMAQDALAEQRRLVALLDGLQAFARGDAGPVERRDVELGDLCDAALTSVRARWPQTTFAASLPDAEVVRQGWEPGLRLLVENLLENAARHGRPGGTVRLTLDRQALVVEDDGPGVPEAERRRVFEPFARLATRDVDGSGLGLALVAQQARLHDATVAVDDSPQLGGARFTVSW
jgi:signal transduction histidine kinase